MRRDIVLTLALLLAADMIVPCFAQDDAEAIDAILATVPEGGPGVAVAWPQLRPAPTRAQPRILPGRRNSR